MSSSKNFIYKRKNLILDELIDFETVGLCRFENRSGVSELGGFNKHEQDSSGFVEFGLTENKVNCSIVRYSSQVKVDNGGGNGFGWFQIKIGADAQRS